ncbi:unnamed protein product [Vitrella brassicaformis CCMP3155]|uniref:Brl1/Brr6 domain-containing protein n=2 Tax=Vitrella brassicaformis TaxID=1169539 RepID=A0A0G4G0Q0_VITBC|nr:unnamed protein product [Vitrella brassicaformis CCMP3155]|eukprot:CEM21637.1 unnamed protein product [Vitrella brassicaformis CCMP3155]
MSAFRHSDDSGKDEMDFEYTDPPTLSLDALDLADEPVMRLRAAPKAPKQRRDSRTADKQHVTEGLLRSWSRYFKGGEDDTTTAEGTVDGTAADADVVMQDAAAADKKETQQGQAAPSRSSFLSRISQAILRTHAPTPSPDPAPRPAAAAAAERPSPAQQQPAPMTAIECYRPPPPPSLPPPGLPTRSQQPWRPFEQGYGGGGLVRRRAAGDGYGGYRVGERGEEEVEVEEESEGDGRDGFWGSVRECAVTVCLVLVLVGLVYNFVYLPHSDASYEADSITRAEMEERLACRDKYESNKCELCFSQEGCKFPALFEPCREYKACMETGHEPLAKRSQILAKNVALGIDAFVRHLSWKSVVVIGMLLSVLVLFSRCDLLPRPCRCNRRSARQSRKQPPTRRTPSPRQPARHQVQQPYLPTSPLLPPHPHVHPHAHAHPPMAALPSPPYYAGPPAAAAAGGGGAYGYGPQHYVGGGGYGWPVGAPPSYDAEERHRYGYGHYGYGSGVYGPPPMQY